MKYTKRYFIDKFQAIHEEKWCVGILTSKLDPECHCALGHCGITTLSTEDETIEAIALGDLLAPVYKQIYGETSDFIDHVYKINDSAKSLGDTPKQRILNALNLVPDETP